MTNDIKDKDKVSVINAEGIYYRQLNEQIKALVASGVTQIRVENVCGQRYVGTDLNLPINMDIYGTPGNDLGAFLKGPSINVYGNAQDGCGNTMDSGEIVVHGHAGDITGLSARGGKMFIRDYVGYRAGIHMKEYGDKKPSLVIGGTAQDFLGEYMAGGSILLLDLDSEGHRAKFIGTGMHGGVIYIRGNVEDYQLGREAGVTTPTEEDYAVIKDLVMQFAGHFNCDFDEIMSKDFIKIYPRFLRPYGRLYTS